MGKQRRRSSDKRKLSAAKQQLKATIQQLKASEQQFKAANQQLRASEQQLKAANQQLRANEQQLKAANQQLDASNQQLRASEEELRKLNRDLGERVEELNCFYGLSQLVEEHDITLEEIFQGLVGLIPPAWQYPDITAARIIFENSRFQTKNFRKTVWIQSADIVVHGRKAGSIEVCYLKKGPVIDEGPFLKDERKVLDILAERSGRITERISAEKELRETHDYLERLINYANAPIIVWDPKFRITRFNYAFERLTGYTADEVIGHKLSILFPKASRDETLGKIKRTLKGEYWESVEIPVLCKDGDIRVALWNSANIYSEDDTTLLATIAQGQDITERKQAEEALRAINQQLRASEQQLKVANEQLQASEQQLKAANQQLRANEQQLRAANQQLEATNQQLRASQEELRESEVFLNATGRMAKVGGWEVDGITKEVRWTEETYRIHEMPLDYKPPLDEAINFFHPEDRPKLASAIQRALEHGEPYDMEIRFITAKGKHLWTHTTCTPRVKDGKTVKLTGTFQDITNRKQVEEALRAANQQLRANEQQLKAANQQLQASEQQLKAANQQLRANEQQLLDDQAQLKQLASQLTLAEESERHRIATELHATIGQSLVVSKLQLETLRASIPSGDIARTLGEVCESLDETIQGTRSLTFDLSSPILYELGFETAVAEWLTERIQQKHDIATEFEDDGQPKPLDDDVRVFLFRDVRELLINVVKHASANKVKVSVCRVGRRIQVSVEDDGWGFDHKKVASTAVRKGGFGLFSIRERLEQLGGELEIESAPGHGTKVTIMAPLKGEKNAEGR